MTKRILNALDLVGLLIIIPAIVTYLVRSVWNNFLTVAVVVGVVFIVVGLASKYQDLSHALRRRSTIFGINSVVFLLLLLGVLGLVNYLGQRHDKRWDLTKAKTFSLSDQTISVLKNLNKKVQIKAFFPEGDDRPTRDLLVEFRSRSRNVDFQFVDPEKQPQIAKKYEVRVYGDVSDPLTGLVYRYGTVTLESDGKLEKIEKQREELQEGDLTNALIKLTKGKTKTVYFLTGHGEKSIDDRDREGYNIAKEALQKEGYEIKTLNLAQERKIPENASAIVIDGPTTEPFPDEIKLIDEYLNRGGSVLVMVDPPPAAGLKSLLKNWSVDVGDNIVVDRLSRIFGGGPAVPLVTKYGKHRITEKLTNVMTFYPLARSVTPAADGKPNVSVEKILETNPFPNSWAETDFKSGSIQFDEKKDIKGPVSIGVAVVKDLADKNGDTKGKEEGKKKARLVVFGDSDFASNVYFTQQGNGDLFLNTIGWLAQEEDLISIRPKSPQDRKIVLSEAQRRILQFFVFLFIPSTILIVGIAVWVKRRQ